MQKDTSRDDWQSLERVFRTFPSTLKQRRVWRKQSASVYESLLNHGHHGLPALIPGLVHARLATALLVAGYRSKSQLASRSFLCLGCHAGLEVRILRDFGAGRAEGIEIRDAVVQEGIYHQLVRADEIHIGDFWHILSMDAVTIWNEIVVLAPEALSLGKLWDTVWAHLSPLGHLIVVAQDADLLDVPSHIQHGEAMEGTMQWYLASKGR